MKKSVLKSMLSSLLIISGFAYSNLSVNATAGYAYSMGGLTTSVQQIIDSANNWALCGYSSYYNTDITYSYLSNSSVLNSSVVYMSGPGSPTQVKLENSLYFTSGSCNGTTDVGVSNYTLSQSKLYVFNASSTASGTTNICTVTRNHGAKAVIGWVGGISVNDSTKWEERFQYKCRNGYTISAAMDYADSFFDYDYSSYIKNHLVYGNWSQTLTWSGSSSIGDEQDRGVDDREVPIDEIKCTYDNIDYDVISDVISAYDSDFDMSDYEVSVTPTSKDNTSFVIDVTKKVGDFSTSSGYTFIFHDEKTDVMYDNTIDSRNEFGGLSEKSVKASISEREAYRTVAESKDEGYYIIDQSVTKYCDLETGKFYNKVYTECKEIAGECCYSYSTFVPIT